MPEQQVLSIETAWRALMTTAAPVLLVGGVGLGTAHAQAPSGDARSVDAPPVVTRLALKTSGLFVRAPDDPLLFPESSSATIYWRARIDSSVRIGPDASLAVAYEQRLRAYSSTVTTFGLGLTTDRPAFRLTPLDWTIASGEHGIWQHEIDRLAVHAAAGAASLTLGRQAVGWGRGLVFGAIDLFSPFSPLEADREWRRGIDAARAEVRLSDRASFDGVAAFGPTLDESAFVGRVRGYFGPIDIQLVGGRRALDAFAGVASSAPLSGAEVHGEVAVFHTPAVPTSPAFAVPRTIAKVVIGASRRVKGDVLISGEYHYSGFGAPGQEDLGGFLADGEVRTRYLRGDMQILRRNAIALVTSRDFSPTLTLGGTWIHTGADDSGVVMPSLNATFSDRWSLEATGYLPYGRAPQATSIPSQYGTTPLGLFIQIRFYR